MDAHSAVIWNAMRDRLAMLGFSGSVNRFVTIVRLVQKEQPRDWLRSETPIEAISTQLYAKLPIRNPFIPTLEPSIFARHPLAGLRRILHLLLHRRSRDYAARAVGVPNHPERAQCRVSGDSILVAQGAYMENLVWPQVSDLHLLSDPANVTRPTIDGGSAGRVVDIEAEGNTVFTAEISGFVITHGFLDVPAHTGETGAGVHEQRRMPASEVDLAKA